VRPSGIKPPRKPQGRIQRASIFSHRSQRRNLATEVSFYAAGNVRHRKSEENSGFSPYVAQTLRLGHDVDMTITFDLADAERIHAALGKAIEEAKIERPCEPRCYLCEDPAPDKPGSGRPQE
jgi:hypothetical protein